jgi:hydroxymethylpyrimidine pyrophosphatase-like HAD family hydrolase
VTTIVASDLDRTLIYSRKAMALGQAAPDITCVEVHDGKAAAFMTQRCANRLDELARSTAVVPVTTRVHSQYQRVTLPMPPPAFAIAANGGLLYVDGEADRAWSKQIRKRLTQQFPFSGVWDYVAQVCHAEWTVKIRNADGLFCYAMVHPSRLPSGFGDDVAGWAAERGWRTSLQGRKLYWVPELLTKSAAVAEVARRMEADTVLAAGDSLLDVDLLLAADHGIHPAHGELFERGWSAPNVSCTQHRGARAGEEIVDWFTRTAGLGD